jgi:hypothetical protein
MGGVKTSWAWLKFSRRRLLRGAGAVVGLVGSTSRAIRSPSPDPLAWWIPRDPSRIRRPGGFCGAAGSGLEGGGMASAWAKF